MGFILYEKLIYGIQRIVLNFNKSYFI